MKISGYSKMTIFSTPDSFNKDGTISEISFSICDEERRSKCEEDEACYQLTGSNSAETQRFGFLLCKKVDFAIPMKEQIIEGKKPFRSFGRKAQKPE